VGPAGDDRLRRLLGTPELAWLVARARRRLELGQTLDATVTLADATTAQRRAFERLLGRAPREGRALRVSLPAVDAVLRRSGACPDGLAAAVERLTGPVAPLAEAHAADERAWAAAYEPLERAVAESGRAELEGWLQRLRGSGTVKRIEPDPLAARELLGRAATVIAALPAQREPLGRFAGRLVGDAHALDDGRPLTTVALGAVRALAGISPPADGDSPAEWRREAWAAVGVLRDPLSSTVLTLGLPGTDETGTGRLLGLAAEAGEPLALTLRQLAAGSPWRGRTLAGRAAHVCENPVVVALAADRLGAACGPLVCVGGQPGAAAMTLLRALAAGGARLRYHGDFDWGGMSIANALHARLSIEPWRYDTAALRSALAAGASGPALRGNPVVAIWDPELAPALRGAGHAVEEEAVADGLLADLG
jgi:uncharacterized protein (TIGR02679 family)